MGFIAALSAAVKSTAVDHGIDHDFPADAIVKIGHQCVLWYQRAQCESVSDPSSGLMSILNAEKLGDWQRRNNPAASRHFSQQK